MRYNSITLMNLNRLLGLGLLLLNLCLVACSSKDDLPTSEAKEANSAERVYLELSAQLAQEQAQGEALRVIGWQGVSRGYQVGVDGSSANLPAVLILKNRAQGASAKTYYLEVEFSRVGNNNRQYRLSSEKIRLDKDIYGTQIHLTRGADQWFACIYLKGQFDKAQKRMGYNPNPELAQNSIPAKKVGQAWVERIDHPIVSDWFAMRLHNENGGNVLHFRPEQGVSIALRPKGVLLSAGFKNEMNHIRRVMRVGLRSNVLSTKEGYYSLAPADLPNLPTTGSLSGGGEARWHTTEQATNNNRYDTGLLQMNSGGHTPNPVPGQNAIFGGHEPIPVIWAMPMPPLGGGSPSTEFYGEDYNRRDRNDYRTRAYWSSTKTPVHTSLSVTAVLRP